MKLNKFLTRTIVVTLLLTFLAFSVGRVNRVSAVGTVATVAGTALLATGVIYMSYLALTGAEIRIPVADDLHLWLQDIGSKVVQYPSGSSAYQEMYEYYSMQDPIANVIDGVWSWTEDKLKSFANDFSDTRIIENIVGYESVSDVTLESWNGFTYPFDISLVPEYAYVGVGVAGTFTYLESLGYTMSYPNGELVCIYDSSLPHFAFTTDTRPLRNLLQNGVYRVQAYDGVNWILISTLTVGVYANDRLIGVNGDTLSYHYSVSTSKGISRNLSYPYLPHCDIYDADNDVVIPAEMPATINNNLPSWRDPDNDNRPIIPWVTIPDLPSSVDVPTGYNNIDQWGFNLEDLLDNLSDLGESIFDIAVLKELINGFAGIHGDDYYLYYDNADTNYYTYYQPTIYEGDYITYNYDISDQEEVMPVNLNDIQLYTDNRYLDAVKENVANFGQAIGEYFAFWHNVDYELTYILFGCAILTLVAMFIGKWGK